MTYRWQEWINDKEVLYDNFVSQGTGLLFDMFLGAIDWIAEGKSPDDYVRWATMFRDDFASIPKDVFFGSMGSAAWAEGEWINRNAEVWYANKLISIIRRYKSALARETLTPELHDKLKGELENLYMGFEGSYVVKGLVNRALRNNVSVDTAFERLATERNLSPAEYQYQISQEIYDGRQIWKNVDIRGEAKRYLGLGVQTLDNIWPDDSSGILDKVLPGVDAKKLVVPGLVALAAAAIFLG